MSKDSEKNHTIFWKILTIIYKEELFMLTLDKGQERTQNSTNLCKLLKETQIL